MASPFDLSGRVALVTGAAQGLGRAIALGLARHGADVALLDRDARRRDGVAAEEVRALGRRALALACDIAEARRSAAAVATTLDEFGRIDVLVNNAGITRRIPLLDWEPADWEEVIRINQVGTFLMAREVGRHMVARRSGSIVNVSALGGRDRGPGPGQCDLLRDQGGRRRPDARPGRGVGRRRRPGQRRRPGWFRTEMNAPCWPTPTLLGRILDRVPLGPARRARGRRGPGRLPRLRRLRHDHRAPPADRRRRVHIVSISNEPVIR